MSKSITAFFSPTKSPKKKEQETEEMSKQEEKTTKKRKVEEEEEEESTPSAKKIRSPSPTPAERAATNKAAAQAKLATKKKTTTSTNKEEKKDTNEKGAIDWDHLEKSIHPSWQTHLSAEFKKPYWNKLKQTLKKEIDAGVEVFPPAHLIFRALQLCPFDEVKVVIIGQDPYHDNGQAEGLCFSVPEGVKVPSSLQNIYKELASDIKGFTKPKHGHLLKWAEQGVLLLNITLTVKAHAANSHKSFGWSNFTDAIVDALNRDRKNLVFLLWGAHAQNKAKSIDKKKHYALQAAHPSGLSASKGFYGCKHFSKCNEYLKEHGQQPIDWQL